MKRVICVLLALVCLIACRATPAEDGTPTTTTTTTEATVTTTESPDLSTAPSSTTITESAVPEETTVGSVSDATTSVTATKRVTTTVAPTTRTTTRTTATSRRSTTTKVTSTATTTTAMSKDKQWYLSLVDSENAWLASCQLNTGAIAMTPTRNGKVKINPYFADIAALSLLNQGDKYGVKVKNYMAWHFSHLNTAQTDPYGVDGTIFDYSATVSSGTVVMEEWLTATPSYDSTDSYAATFLMVVAKYAEQTGDTAYVTKNADKIRRVVNALMSTMDNGLTTGRPNSDVKMLMDNCEVYAGLQATARLYRQVLLPAGAVTSAEADRLQSAADSVAAHVESDLWTGTHYRNDIRSDGTSYYPFSWGQYYPSAVAQLFPMLHGLLDPTSQRAKDLYGQFCRRYDWENLNHPDNYVWASNAYTAALMGDVDSVKTFLTAYERMVKESRGYPLYNADAAWACMTAYYMSQRS